MLMEITHFDGEIIDELVEKVEKGEFFLPITLSEGTLSCINGML